MIARASSFIHKLGHSVDLPLLVPSSLPAKIAETLDPLEISVEGGEVSGR